MELREPSLNELERINALRELAVLDTLPEDCYDSLVKLAAQICETPIAAISLVDQDRTWSKSILGLKEAGRNCPREYSFCAVAIQSDEPVFAIRDARLDAYFENTPLVVEEPKIAFYAAAPLKTMSGHTVGTICVLDHVPRELTQSQNEALRTLGDQVTVLLETRAQLTKTKVHVSKLLESSASKSEAYLRATLNSIDAGFIGIDPRGTITICNDASISLLGYKSVSEVIGRPFTDIVRYSKDTQQILSISENPLLAAAQAGRRSHNDGFFQRADASWLPAESWVSPIVQNGALSGAVVCFMDVSARKETERRLARERHLLDQIFMSSPAAMATWIGDDLIFDRVNERFERIFPNRSLDGKRLLEACPELEGQKFDEMLREVMRSGKAIAGSEVVAQIAVAAGGALEDRYFNFTYLPVYDDAGRAYAVYNHSIDVTESVRAKQTLEKAILAAESASIAKSQFLANMSHEIRTPLGAILGFADILSDEASSPEERMHIHERIRSNGVQLTNLIDDLLDLTKVEADRINIESLEVDLESLLAELRDLYLIKAKERKITLQLSINGRLPKSIVSDPTRIRQILDNIVGNAVKFTPMGGRVHIEAKSTMVDARTRIEFIVADNGPGMTPEQMQRLFQPFTQADVSTTRKYGGSGLGLFVSRRLAKLLGGDVSIQSSVVGQGSVFSVTIVSDVRARSGEFSVLSTPVPEHKASSERRKSLEGMRVLVVDDAPDNRELIRVYLNRAGAVAEFAVNGRDGVTRALQENFDIVLMDIQMPVLDGNSAMRELVLKSYAKPVIALTAHAMAEERNYSLQLGFRDYLTKPIARATLEQAIENLVSENRAE